MEKTVYVLMKRRKFSQVSRNTAVFDARGCALIDKMILSHATPKGWKMKPVWSCRGEPSFYSADSYMVFDTIKDAAEHLRKELGGAYAALTLQAKLIAELCDQCDEIYMSAKEPD